MDSETTRDFSSKYGLLDDVAKRRYTSRNRIGLRKVQRIPTAFQLTCGEKVGRICFLSLSLATFTII